MTLTVSLFLDLCVVGGPWTHVEWVRRKIVAAPHRPKVDTHLRHITNTLDGYYM